MDMITGKGPSNRHEIWYFGESELGAVRIDDYKFRFIDQPGGWLGDKTKPDVPYITNLRLDPFERTGWPNNGTKDGAQQYFDWFKYEFWRFVFVQQAGREAGDDCDRVSADAEGRELQPRCRESENRRSPGGDRQIGRYRLRGAAVVGAPIGNTFAHHSSKLSRPKYRDPRK